MADETRKIAHLVGTTAQGAAGGGRKGLLMHDTDIGTLKMQLDAEGAYAIYARRDAAQTFTGLQTFTDGVKDSTLTAGLPMVAGTAGRLTTQDAEAFRAAIGAAANPVKLVGDPTKTHLYVEGNNGYFYDDYTPFASFGGGKFGAEAIWSFARDVEWLSRTELTGPGFRPLVAGASGEVRAQDAAIFRGTIGVSVADGQVARGTTGGAVTGDAGLTTTQSGGVTDSLGIGNGSGAAYARVNAAAGNNSSMYLQNGGVNRWGMIRVATSNAWWLRAYDAAGSAIDNPIEVVNALGGAITLGGGAATKRDVNITKDLQLSGTTRISAAGRIDITSIYNSAWAGAGIRPLLTDNVGMGYATDALTFRGAIGVKERAYAQIYRTGAAVAQSIPTGTAYTKITPFNANDADYLDATPDQANDRIVIGRAGRYHIVFSRSFSVGTANTTWLSAVLKNGTAVPASIQQVKMVNATTSTYATSDCQVTCAAGDVITFGVQHGNGASVDITYEYATLYVDALD